MLNWTKDYDISWRRFGVMSILKIDMLQVPCHGDQEMRELKVRLLTTMLFVLVYRMVGTYRGCGVILQ